MKTKKDIKYCPTSKGMVVCIYNCQNGKCKAVDNKLPNMQTAVEWLIEQLMERGFQEKNYKIIEQAKEMEKQQIIDAHKDGAMFEMDADKFGKDYYNETYGSKGSDDIKGIGSKDINGNEMIFDQELFNYFSQEFNISLLGTEIQDIIDIVKRHISSQTEISDEEEWAAALKLTDNIQEHNGWEKAIKWYREQLKKKNL